MRTRSFRKPTLGLAALLVGAAILAAPMQSFADPTPTLQLSWNQDKTLLGNDTTDTSITINAGPVNGFTVTGTAEGTNYGFGPGIAGLDYVNLNIMSTGAGTLVLYLTQNNQTFPATYPSSGVLTATLSGGFTSGTGSASLVSYGTDDNQLYGNATGQPMLTPTITPGAKSEAATPSVGLGGSATASFYSTNKFAMEEVLTINFGSGGGTASVTSGLETFSTPEPATLAMIAATLPLLGIGMFLRRRRRAKA